MDGIPPSSRYRRVRRARRRIRFALTPIERMFLTCAAFIGGIVLVLYLSGLGLERAESDDRSATLRAGGANLGATAASILSGGRPSGIPGVTPSDATDVVVPRVELTQVASLPDWVQAIRGTRLWTDATGREQTSAISQWQFLHVVGASGDRFRVEVDSDGGFRQSGWIDVDDVGVSAAPPPWVRSIRDTWLFSTSDSGDSITVVPAATDFMVAGEIAGTRIFVYLPTEPTSRRTGYGWVELDAVEATRAPRGVALPSPTFRAVPLGVSGSYRVRPGDSIQSLATQSGISGDDVIRLNGLDRTGRIMVGQVLQLPDRAPKAPLSTDGPRLTRNLSPGWVSAEYAVVVDDASGEILWARDANSPVAPASLTKIMTSLVVLDHARLTDVVSVQVDSRRMPGSTIMGLRPGEELTVEDLLYGLMLPSGNDAALALAEHVAGTNEAFVDLMNSKARALGLVGSHFVNPHGLDAAGHQSTAFDMAMMARAGMQDPTFRALASAKTYDSGSSSRYHLTNLNQLLWRYPGADGVKIGFTDAAGRAIVGSATQDGHRVFVAMMRSADIYADAAALLDWAFASYTWS